MKENILQIKAFEFAKKTVFVYQYLLKKNIPDLARQFLKSGTSIGANIEEAIGGSSEKDFSAKLSIAYKEARESVFWIKLLQSTGYLSEDKANILLIELEEICKIIGKTISTIKSKNKITNV